MGGLHSANIEELDQKFQNGEDIDKYVLDLFNEYDWNVDGILHGFEVCRIIETIGNYLYKRSKLDKTRNVLSGHVITWVDEQFDVNRDGIISRKEFVEKIKAVLQFKPSDIIR